MQLVSPQSGQQRDQIVQSHPSFSMQIFMGF